MIEILNRQAKFNYEILETFEAGIVLTGTEIKSLKNGNANIKDSYAIIKNEEIFLLNMQVSLCHLPHSSWTVQVTLEFTWIEITINHLHISWLQCQGSI